MIVPMAWFCSGGSLYSSYMNFHFGLIFTCSVSCLYSIRLCSVRSFAISLNRFCGTFKALDSSLMLCHELSFIRLKNKPSLVNFFCL